MIDQWSEDRRGWARFSDDELFRYRLARSLNGGPLSVLNDHVLSVARCVWLMCNPSTADAFQVDPTVRECIGFATAWGCDVTEVVNLWALRSPHPADLRKRALGQRGDDMVNNDAVLQACIGAHWVIAAWGANGALDWRAHNVRQMLVDERGIALHHLGTTTEGYPKHPLARGTHRIPRDQVPVRWEVASG